MVELSNNGTYWKTKTAGVFKISHGANKEEIYTRHTTDKQPAETVEESQGDELSGTHTPSRMNSPTSSVQQR